MEYDELGYEIKPRKRSICNGVYTCCGYVLLVTWGLLMGIIIGVAIGFLLF